MTATATASPAYQNTKRDFVWYVQRLQEKLPFWASVIVGVVLLGPVVASRLPFWIPLYLQQRRCRCTPTKASVSILVPEQVVADSGGMFSNELREAEKPNPTRTGIDSVH